MQQGRHLVNIKKRILNVVCILGVVVLGFNLTEVKGELPATPLSENDKLKLGERMYRDGVLPSGEPMQAVVKGDLTVSGTTFTCVSCHLRSGLGSFEGGVVTPPTNGPSLFQPQELRYKTVKLDSKLYPVPIHRKAYTDESLALALRGGVDPSGHVFNPVMPRYFLQDADMEILVSYLKTLSAEPAPGVTDNIIRLATVVTDDVSPDDEKAMMSALENFVRQKNNLADLYATSQRSARMAATMLLSSEVMYKKLSLVQWKLTASPDTWRLQLERFYRKEPVFALLGGISSGEWKPIHDFCEKNHIPSLFPQTEYPVISETDWYTLYFSKGYYQEGESAAHYLNSKHDYLTDNQVIQIVRNSRQGRTLARGFEESWHDAGRHQPATILLENGEKLSAVTVQNILEKNPKAVVLLWDGNNSLDDLEILGSTTNRPDMIFVSSSYMGNDFWKIREQDRETTYLTYPYRLPQNEAFYKSQLNDISKKLPLKGNAENITKRVYSASQVFNLALMDMRGNYNRDNLFDVIGMLNDQDLPLYERLSFGPGQRYASKGCYIVQLGKGIKPEIMKKSDWVIY
jgi:hypothetical protein